MTAILARATSLTKPQVTGTHRILERYTCQTAAKLPPSCLGRRELS